MPQHVEIQGLQQASAAPNGDGDDKVIDGAQPCEESVKCDAIGGVDTLSAAP